MQRHWKTGFVFELVVLVRVELIDWAMCVKVAKVETLTKCLQLGDAPS